MNMDENIGDHSQKIEICRELYRAAVNYTSHRVTEFCEPTDDDTTVIITASHCERLAERE